ncbi:hypothetical protein IQ269_02520 [Tychonema sp. LEGE 07199]|nr:MULTISPECIES: hypothetical protein [unclassified Tychonema]MBE9119706.1 hypothetical protein [Tychonema sp. LEGE 07199]MBE9130769.1 hypothetical protein [Tychonema sp. LEGE 07196]
MLSTGCYVFKARRRSNNSDRDRAHPDGVADAGSTATPFNKVYLKKD